MIHRLENAGASGFGHAVVLLEIAGKPGQGPFQQRRFDRGSPVGYQLERRRVVGLDVGCIEKHRNHRGHRVGGCDRLFLHQLQRRGRIEVRQQDTPAPAKEIRVKEKARDVEQGQVLQQYIVRRNFQFHRISYHARGKGHPVDRRALGAPRRPAGVKYQRVQRAICWIVLRAWQGRVEQLQVRADNAVFGGGEEPMHAAGPANALYLFRVIPAADDHARGAIPDDVFQLGIRQPGIQGDEGEARTQAGCLQFDVLQFVIGQ